jgi:hypothetical protein
MRGFDDLHDRASAYHATRTIALDQATTEFSLSFSCTDRPQDCDTPVLKRRYVAILVSRVLAHCFGQSALQKGREQRLRRRLERRYATSELCRIDFAN